MLHWFTTHFHRCRSLRSLFTTSTSCLPSSRATFASLLPNPLFNGQKWSSGRWNAEQSTTISITMFVDDCAVKRCGYVNLGMRYMMWGKLFERKGMWGVMEFLSFPLCRLVKYSIATTENKKFFLFVDCRKVISVLKAFRS